MSYAHAVLAPFEPDAEGAQIPDLYSFPTAPAHLKTSFSLKSGTNGDFDLALLPSILASVYTNGGLYTNFSNSFSYPPLHTPTVTTSGAAISGVANQTFMQTVDQYRLVGCGMRLRSMLVPQTSTGTLYLASFPAGDHVLNYTNQSIINQLGYQWGPNNQTDVQLLNGFPQIQSTTSTDPAGNTVCLFDPIFQSAPTAKVMEHFEFNQNGLEFSCKPISPEALNWRAGQNNTQFGPAATPYQVGIQPALQSTGAPLAASGLSKTGGYTDEYERTAGWSAFYLRGVGFPSNVTIATVEIIYHIEYLPLAGSLLSLAKFPQVNKGLLDEVLNAAARMPLYRTLRDAAATQGEQVMSRLGL